MNAKTLGILLVVIIMVLIRVVNLGYMPETHNAATTDEARTLGIAKNIVETGQFTGSRGVGKHDTSLGDVFITGPLTIYITAISFWLFGVGYAQGRLVGVVFGLLTVILIYLIGKRMYGRKVALISFIIAGLHPLFAFYNRVAAHDSISLFFFLMAIYAAMMVGADDRKKDIMWLALVGVSSALSGMARYNGVMVFGIVLLYFLVSRWKRWKVFLRDAGVSVCFLLASFVPFLAWLAGGGSGFMNSFFNQTGMALKSSGMLSVVGGFGSSGFFLDMIKTIVFYYPLLVIIVIAGGFVLLWKRVLKPSFRMGEGTKMLAIWFIFSFAWWIQSSLTGKYSLVFGLPLFIIAGKIISDCHNTERGFRLLATLAVALLICFYVFSAVLFVSDFRSTAAYEMADKVKGIEERVYFVESEMTFLSQESLFPFYWMNGTNVAGAKDQEIFVDWNGTAMSYLENARPEHIVLSRITAGIHNTPRNEFRELIKKYGKLELQTGPYNYYTLDWDSPNKEPLEITYLASEGYDMITLIKNLLGSR